MVYEDIQQPVSYGMPEMQPLVCNSFDDMLHQLNAISEETLDDTAQAK